MTEWLLISGQVLAVLTGLGTLAGGVWMVRGYLAKLTEDSAYMRGQVERLVNTQSEHVQWIRAVDTGLDDVRTSVAKIEATTEAMADRQRSHSDRVHSIDSRVRQLEAGH